ncbi:hypothetical protein G4B88_009064 [Cannabis sativa]|uniref:Small multi-drug export protein n=1 Tax=Cannabis sativa TaxID=3483 RepID=A0A7J6HR47_CANSA|nr:hypothetical protein G4B88_009064 [Cannabis sativa]
MAPSLSLIKSPLPSKSYLGKTLLRFSPIQNRPTIIHARKPLPNSNGLLKFHSFGRFRPLIANSHSPRVSSEGFLDTAEENENMPSFEERPLKFAFWVLFWASLSLVWFATSKDANAAADSIKASSFGLKIANKLRSSGWPDEAVVFSLATLPLLELRGAIPVGYWNMVPVPFIMLYLKKLASFAASRNKTVARFVNILFENAKAKAGPVEEFQWLGLMLFVAVPFPGTGAWTGAFIASILDMPFWSALSANFVGVVFAGLLVNLLVNLGLKYAIITGIILFLVSTFMWTILRSIRKSLSSSN